MSDTTEVVEAPDSPPEAVSNWIKGLGEFGTEAAPEPTPTPPPAKKEPDGKVNADAGSNATVGAKSGADVAADKPAGTADAGKPAADTKDAKGEDTKADKKTEAVPDDDKETWPRNAKDWDKFKANRKKEREELQAQIKAEKDAKSKIEAQLKEITEKPPKEVTPQEKIELENTRKQLAEYSKRIQELDVTQEPKFQAYFQNKVDAQITLARNIVGGEKADEIAKLLKMPNTDEIRPVKDAKIEEFMSELSPIQQTRIGGILNEMERIDLEKGQEIQKAKDHAETIKAERVAQFEQAKTARVNLFSDSLKLLQNEKDGHPLYQLREGDDEWNASVNTRIAVAKSLFSGDGIKDPKQVALAALVAAAYPAGMEMVKGQIAEKDAKIATLEAQIKELSAAQPNLKAGGTAGSPSGEPAKPATPEVGATPAEAMKAWTQGLWRQE